MTPLPPPPPPPPPFVKRFVGLRTKHLGLSPAALRMPPATEAEGALTVEANNFANVRSDYKLRSTAKANSETSGPKSSMHISADQHSSSLADKAAQPEDRNVQSQTDVESEDNADEEDSGTEEESSESEVEGEKDSEWVNDEDHEPHARKNVIMNIPSGTVRKTMTQ